MRNPEFPIENRKPETRDWIPAFAGMTGEMMEFLLTGHTLPSYKQ
jgi:hypothetical protein